ncbi:hypothetical protein D5085_11450 [Ectothiorhodospiraceae bacterium BW-2]|nr:hypothetical protein D5085_11450 [Ectothiorhodospiraceae bacterium BW-2]
MKRLLLLLGLMNLAVALLLLGERLSAERAALSLSVIATPVPDQIQLLSELSAAQLQQRKKSAPAKSPPAPIPMVLFEWQASRVKLESLWQTRLPDEMSVVPQPPRYCLQAQQLLTVTEVERWSHQLEPLGEVSQQQVPQQVERYWVMIPQQRLSQSAPRLVTVLKSQGVVDVAQIFVGEHRGAVSLGLFSQRSSAERRLQQVNRLLSKREQAEVVVQKRQLDRIALYLLTERSLSELPASVTELAWQVVERQRCHE